MITRYVETDLRKVAQKINDDRLPRKIFAIHRFEENLTRRGAKKPFFKFTTVSTGGKDKTGKMGAVSLSGICALTVIPDKKEMKEANTEMKISLKEYGKWKMLVAPKKQ